MGDRKRQILVVSILAAVSAIGLWVPYWIGGELPLPPALTIGSVAILRIGVFCGFLLWLRGPSGLRGSLAEWFAVWRTTHVVVPVVCIVATIASLRAVSVVPWNGIPPWDIAVSMALIAPLTEEVICRGVWVGVLMGEVRLSPVTSILGAGLVFGGLHAPAGMVTTEWEIVLMRFSVYSAVGSGLGWMFVLGGGSLWACIAFHCGVNFMAAAVVGGSGIAGMRTAAVFWGGVLGALGMTCLLISKMKARETKQMGNSGVDSIPFR